MEHLVENPIVLGLVVTIIVWLVKFFGWAPDGWQSVVTTMIVSLILAVIEAFAAGELAQLTPDAAFQTTATILLASQIIYQTIRRSIDVYKAATQKPV